MKICLLFHSTCSENLGVGALTQSQIDILKSVAHHTRNTPHITIVDWKTPNKAYISDPLVTVLPVGRSEIMNPLKLMSALYGSDLVIDIGAGDSFSDIYGAKRYWLMSLIKLQALVGSKQYILAPQTIGPFTKRHRKFVARILTKLATKIIVRDERSADYVSQWSLGSKLVTATDLAFSLPFTQHSKSRKRPKVGLNLSALLWHEGANFALETSFQTTTQSLIKNLLEHPEKPEIFLVPHVLASSNKIEDDYALAKLLQKRFPTLKIAPRFKDPSDAKSFISGLDFLVGTRMHACIAAVSSGVACTPWAYSRKFEGLFSDLNYNHVNDLRSLNSQELVAQAIDDFDRRLEIAQDARASQQAALRRLTPYINLLNSEFSRTKRKVTWFARA